MVYSQYLGDLGHHIEDFSATIQAQIDHHSLCQVIKAADILQRFPQLHKFRAREPNKPTSSIFALLGYLPPQVPLSLWTPPHGLGSHPLPRAGLPLPLPQRDHAPAISRKRIPSTRSRVLEQEVKPSSEGLGKGLEGPLLLQLGLAGGPGLLDLKGPEAAGGGSRTSRGTATRGGSAGGLLGCGEELGIRGLEIEAAGARLALRRAPRGLEVGYVSEKQRRRRRR